MGVTTLAAPLSTDLTTLAAARASVKLDTTAQDADLLRLIGAASDAIVRHTARSFARAQYQETVKGYGTTNLLLSCTPVLTVSQTLYRNTPLVDVGIDDPAIGLLYRQLGTEATRQFGWGVLDSYPMTASEVADYSVTYWAGWLLPGDDVRAESLSAAAVDNAYVVTAPATMPRLIPGDVVVASGFTQAANNGAKTVVTRTDTRVVVTPAGLVDEPAQPGREAVLAVSTLPRDIEYACLETIKAWSLARGRDPNIATRTVGDLSVTYRNLYQFGELQSLETLGLPLVAIGLLTKWVRVAP